MQIVEYKDKYRAECLAIFDSNSPRYFAEKEREIFESFLKFETLDNPYFVVKFNKTLVACGGYEVSGSRAGLTWGMVLDDWHRKQFGTKLLQYRLTHLRRVAKTVVIDTSQHAEAFFKKFGFVTINKIENGYSSGLHKIFMQLELQD